jgi:CMP-N,N'-diacetyllegionaminic acid synthase
MIEGKKVLALIPARGGSKGIKDKNIYNLSGKPLISYTIETALMSNYIDSVVVSTDSNKIRTVALQSGARVPFLRPKKLASDTAKTVNAVIHAVKILSDMGEIYDVLILLQTTQPLRNCADIDGALEIFIKNGYRSLASVCEVDAHPLLIRTMKTNNELVRMCNMSSTVRRQDMEKYYHVNGAIYINKISEINEDTSFNDNEVGFVMPKTRSIDIDEPIDLVIAEAMIDNSMSTK